MTLRVAAVAALGAIMLAGCSAGPSAAPSPSPSATTSDLTVRATLIEYACEYMKDPAATVRGLGRDLVNRDQYPDMDTAAYAARDAISEGCPQYADR